MASAIHAAVKPVNGLNTLVIGTPIGALFAGSVFMTVTTTGAIALAVGDAVGKTGADERTGLGQLGDLTGYSSEYNRDGS